MGAIGNSVFSIENRPLKPVLKNLKSPEKIYAESAAKTKQSTQVVEKNLISIRDDQNRNESIDKRISSQNQSATVRISSQNNTVS